MAGVSAGGAPARGAWGPVADFAGRVGIVGLMGAMGAACRLEITGLQGNDDEIWEVENGCGDSGSVSASGYFVQNLAGSFFIALLGRRGWHMRDSLGLGWSSGFCGSLTTFATWMQYTAVLLAGGHTNLAWATLVGMHCTALCAHKMGQLLSEPGYCMKALRGAEPDRRAGCSSDDEESSSSEEDGASSDDPAAAQGPTSASAPGAITARYSFGQARRRDVVCVIFWPALAVVVAALTVVRFCTAIANDEKAIWGAIAMAPAGAILRYLLSLGNKHWNLQIPWFTFAANLLGCGADAVMVWQLSRGGDGQAQDFWRAFGVGFGGSLSTVSTFMNELRGTKIPELRERAAYAFVSYGAALALLVPVNLASKCA